MEPHELTEPQPPRKPGRPRRVPNAAGLLRCNNCEEMKNATDFYRNNSTGRFDTYCTTCRKEKIRSYSGRTGKQNREVAWNRWARSERIRLEAAGHEFPPGYEEGPKFETPEVTPETVQGRRPLGPPE